MATLSTCPPLVRESVVEAHERIKPFVHETPVMTCGTIDLIASTPRTPEELRAVGMVNADGEKNEEKEKKKKNPASPRVRLYFKCENLQKVGAFKARGAFHALERLKMGDDWEGKDGAKGVKDNGVVTHSSGNHAAALALAAKTNGVPAHIIMPFISPPSKIAATRSYGANIIFSGSTAPERHAVCAKVQEETGAALVPPYDHPDVVLGQGTMGLELVRQAGEIMIRRNLHKSKKTLDAIIAPCSGGGMLSGVALSVSLTDPETKLPVPSAVRVFGAEPSFQGADDLCRSMRTGKRVTEVKSLTIADGLRTPVGDVPWYLIVERKLVKNAYPVTEAAILATMKLVAERMKLVLEPSAAVALAAILYNEELRSQLHNDKEMIGTDTTTTLDIGVIFSGGNCDVSRWVELFGPGSVGEGILALGS